MATNANLYRQMFLQALGSGVIGNAPNIDWLSDDIRVMLCTASYVPNLDTHVFKSDVTNEISGTGYVAGGAALTSKTATYDAPSDTTTWDAADTVWATATFTCRYAVIYNNTPASNKPLLALIDFLANQSPSAGNFTIQWNPAGIFTSVAV